MQAATRSPFQTARPGHLEPVDREAVGEDVGRPLVEQRHRPAQRLDVGDVHAEPVALLGVDHHHRPGDRTAHDLGVDALAGLLGEQLGVGQARARCRPCPAGRMQAPATSGPAHAPRPGLVDAGDRARSRRGAARARSRRARRRGGRSRREGRCVRACMASRADSRGGSGTSSNVSGRETQSKRSRGHSSTKTWPTTRSTGTNSWPGTQSVSVRLAHVLAGVGRVAAVVAHHEDVALGHRTGRPVRRALVDHRAVALDARRP